MSQEVLPDFPVQRYRGPSKPEMPYSVSPKSQLSLRVLARQMMSASRTKKLIIEVGTPEYHGYDTKNAREQGHTVRPATKAIHLPLVDVNPAESETQC